MTTLDQLDIPTEEKSQLSRVHAALLETLLELDRVCGENGLQYWLAGGSCLGAVRNGGFIPWDDDADVIMKRGDFEALVAHRDDFGGGFRLVLPHELDNDSFIDPVTRVYNLSTRLHESGGRDEFYGEIQNHCWVDIFVYDQVPDSDLLGKVQYRQVMLLYMLLMGHRYRGDSSWSFTPLQRLVVRAASAVGRLIPARTLLSLYESCSSHYNGHPRCGRYRGFTVTWDHVWIETPSEADVETCIRVPFEGVSLPIPVGYDNYLRMIYGDYMREPPKEAVERELNSKHYSSRDSGFRYEPPGSG
ncbi:MAG: LicD family protein [Treponema sp.]|nr:LicD family protein [Treponema sp.]